MGLSPREESYKYKECVEVRSVFGGRRGGDECLIAELFLGKSNMGFQGLQNSRPGPVRLMWCLVKGEDI